MFFQKEKRVQQRQYTKKIKKRKKQKKNEQKKKKKTIDRKKRQSNYFVFDEAKKKIDQKCNERRCRLLISGTTLAPSLIKYEILDQSNATVQMKKDRSCFHIEGQKESLSFTFKPNIQS